MNDSPERRLPLETAWYLRVFDDAEFRRVHIGGLVCCRRILLGLLAVLGTGWIGVAFAYGGEVGLVWALLFSPAFAVYHVFGSRLSALRAIEHKVGRPDEPPTA